MALLENCLQDAVSGEQKITHEIRPRDIHSSSVIIKTRRSGLQRNPSSQLASVYAVRDVVRRDTEVSLDTTIRGAVQRFDFCNGSSYRTSRIMKVDNNCPTFSEFDHDRFPSLLGRVFEINDPLDESPFAKPFVLYPRSPLENAAEMWAILSSREALETGSDVVEVTLKPHNAVKIARTTLIPGLEQMLHVMCHTENVCVDRAVKLKAPLILGHEDEIMEAVRKRLLMLQSQLRGVRFIIKRKKELRELPRP